MGGRRDHNCAQCGKNFSSAQYLKRHIEFVHDGRRDHNCAQCGKDFSTAQYLKVHIKCVHEGQKDYNCTECGKDFSSKQKLKVHIKCIHEGLRDYNYAECGKDFSYSKDLKKHIECEHEKRKAPKLVPDDAAAADEENSKIVHETKNGPMSESKCAPNDAIGDNIEIKNEQLDTEEMPTFEHDSTYLDNEIKKEIKIEPLESVHDYQ